MEVQNLNGCNIIAYLDYNGPFLNSVTAFVHSHIYPQCCRSTDDKGKFVRVESKCETTSDMVVYALTGKFNEFRLIQFKDLSLDNVMKELHKWNLISIDIPCKNQNSSTQFSFGGHNLIIVKNNKFGETGACECEFYIIQSYIFEYNLQIHVANETQIRAYISNYLSIFNSDQHKWSRNDIVLWKCITGVTLSETLINSNKPVIYIKWWYSSPRVFNLNSKDCGRFIRRLLEEAWIKVGKSTPEEIEDIFGNVTLKQVIDNILQLLDDLNSLEYFKLNASTITNSGCLTEIFRMNQQIKSENKQLENECDKPISSIEVAKYLFEYEPLASAKLYFSKEKEFWCYIAEITIISNHIFNIDNIPGSRIPHIHIGLIRADKEYTGNIELGNLDKTMANNLKQYMEIDNYTIPFEYDLMTMYYCYKDRLPCMQSDPKYAKKKIIEYFEDTIRSTNYEDQLVFLRTNAKIMSINIKGYSEYYKFFDKKIKEEVKALEKLVRSRLESLD